LYDGRCHMSIKKFYKKILKNYNFCKISKN
jgi:hypothetical protein